MSVLIDNVEKTAMSEAEDIKAKIKQAFNFKGKFIALFLIILLTAIGFTFGRYNPTTDTISKFTNDLLKQYETKLKSDKVIITGLENDLKMVNENYTILSNKIKNLKVNYENVKEPQNIAEIKDRFTKLGFPPI